MDESPSNEQPTTNDGDTPGDKDSSDNPPDGRKEDSLPKLNDDYSNEPILTTGLGLTLLRFSNTIKASNEALLAKSDQDKSDSEPSDLNAQNSHNSDSRHSRNSSSSESHKSSSRDLGNSSKGDSRNTSDFQNRRNSRDSRFRRDRNFENSSNRNSFNEDSKDSQDRDSNDRSSNRHSRRSSFDSQDSRKFGSGYRGQRNRDGNNFGQNNYDGNNQRRFGFGPNNFDSCHPNNFGPGFQNCGPFNSFPDNSHNFGFNGPPNSGPFNSCNPFNPPNNGFQPPPLMNQNVENVFPPFGPPNGPPGPPGPPLGPFNNQMFNPPFGNQQFEPFQGPPNMPGPMGPMQRPDSQFGPPQTSLLGPYPVNGPPNQDSFNNCNYKCPEPPPALFRSPPPPPSNSFDPGLQHQPPMDIGGGQQCPPNDFPPPFLSDSSGPQTNALPLPSPNIPLGIPPPLLPPKNAPLEIPKMNSNSSRRDPTKKRSSFPKNLVHKPVETIPVWSIAPPPMPPKNDIPLPLSPPLNRRSDATTKRETTSKHDLVSDLAFGKDQGDSAKNGHDREKESPKSERASLDNMDKSFPTKEEDDDNEAFVSASEITPSKSEREITTKAEDSSDENTTLVNMEIASPSCEEESKAHSEGNSFSNDDSYFLSKDAEALAQGNTSATLESEESFIDALEASPTCRDDHPLSREKEREALLTPTPDHSLPSPAKLDHAASPNKKSSSTKLTFDHGFVKDVASSHNSKRLFPCLTKEEARKRLKSFSTIQAFCKDKKGEKVPKSKSESKTKSQESGKKGQTKKKKKENEKISVIEEIRDYENRVRETLGPCFSDFIPEANIIIGNTEALNKLEAKGVNLKELAKKREEALSLLQEEASKNPEKTQASKSVLAKENVQDDSRKDRQEASKQRVKDSAENDSRDGFKRDSQSRKEKDVERKNRESSKSNESKKVPKDKYKSIKSIPNSWADLKSNKLALHEMKDVIYEVQKREFDRYGDSKRDHSSYRSKRGENSFIGLFNCKPLRPKDVLNEHKRLESYPGSFIKYTTAQPSISYSINKKFSADYYSRREVRMRVKGYPQVLKLMQEVWDEVEDKPHTDDRASSLLENKWYPWDWASYICSQDTARNEGKPENALDMLSSNYNMSEIPFENTKMETEESYSKDLKDDDDDQEAIKDKDIVESPIKDKPKDAECSQNKDSSNEVSNKISKLKEEVKSLLASTEFPKKIYKLKEKEVKSLLAATKDKTERKSLKELKKKLKKEKEKRKSAKREARRKKAKLLKAEKKAKKLKKAKKRKNKKKTKEALNLSTKASESGKPNKEKTLDDSKLDQMDSCTTKEDESKSEVTTSETSGFYNVNTNSPFSSEELSPCSNIEETSTNVNDASGSAGTDRYSPSNLFLYSSDSLEPHKPGSPMSPSPQLPHGSPPSPHNSPFSMPLSSYKYSDSNRQSFSPYSPSSPQISGPCTPEAQHGISSPSSEPSFANATISKNVIGHKLYESALKFPKDDSSPYQPAFPSSHPHFIQKVCSTLDDIPKPVPPVHLPPSSSHSSIVPSLTDLEFSGLKEAMQFQEVSPHDDNSISSPKSIKKEAKPVMFRLNSSKKSSGMQLIKKKMPLSAFALEDENESSLSPLIDEDLSTTANDKMTSCNKEKMGEKEAFEDSKATGEQKKTYEKLADSKGGRDSSEYLPLKESLSSQDKTRRQSCSSQEHASGKDGDAFDYNRSSSSKFDSTFKSYEQELQQSKHESDLNMEETRRKHDDIKLRNSAIAMEDRREPSGSEVPAKTSHSFSPQVNESCNAGYHYDKHNQTERSKDDSLKSDMADSKKHDSYSSSSQHPRSPPYHSARRSSRSPPHSKRTGSPRGSSPRRRSVYRHKSPISGSALSSKRSRDSRSPIHSTRSSRSDDRGTYHSKKLDSPPRYSKATYSSRYSRSPPPYRKSRHSRSPDRRDRSPRQSSRSPPRKRSKSPLRRYSPRRQHSPSRSLSPYDHWKRVRSPPPKYRRESSRYHDDDRKRSHSPGERRKEDKYSTRKSPSRLQKDDYTDAKSDSSKQAKESSKFVSPVKKETSFQEDCDASYHSYKDKEYLSPESSPKRLSLDERLKQEHGLVLEEPPQQPPSDYSSDANYWSTDSQVQQDPHGDSRRQAKVVRIGNVLQVLPHDSSPEKMPSSVHHPDYFPSQRSVQSENIIQIPMESTEYSKRDSSSILLTSPVSLPTISLPTNASGPASTPVASSATVTAVAPVPSPVPPPTTRVRIVIPKSVAMYSQSSSSPKMATIPSSPSTTTPILESPLKGSHNEPLDADDALMGSDQEALTSPGSLSFTSQQQQQQQQAIISAAAVAAAAAATAGVTPSNIPIAHLISVLQQQNLLSGQSFGQTGFNLGEPLAASPAVEPSAVTTSATETVNADQTSSQLENDRATALKIEAYKMAKLERKMKRKREKQARKEAKRIEFERKLAMEKEMESLNNSFDFEDDEAVIKEAISEVPDLGSPIPDYELYNDDEDEEEEEDNPKKMPIVILPPPDKSILVSPTSRHQGRSVQKSVSFADGVIPGEGTSPSGGEEIHSPPPPDKSSKKKEKKMRKKKSVRVKAIKEFIVDDGINSPPPPPPTDPPQDALKLYPGCSHCTFTAPTTVVLYTQQPPDAKKVTLVDLPNGNTVTIPPGMLMHSTAFVK